MAFDGTLKFDTAIDKKGFQTGLSKLGGLAKTGLSLVGRSITAASTSLSGLGGYAVNVGKNFESSMSKVAAVSGATGDEFDALRNKASELGENTIFSASEAADALNYMAMAGWKTEEMLDGVGGVLDLAASSGADLATTSDIVTDALTAFGEPASSAGRLADVMAAAASNANTNVEMMGETFKYVAPVAGSLGYSMEDSAVAIGLMANSGIKASQAGTALRSALTHLVKPTDKSAEAMDRLGFYTKEYFKSNGDPKEIEKASKAQEKAAMNVLTAQNNLKKATEKYGKDSAEAEIATRKLNAALEEQKKAEEALTAATKTSIKERPGYNQVLLNEDGSMKSLSETMDMLREKMGDLSEAEQAAAAAQIFGTEAMSGMLAIINASDEDYQKLTAAIRESEGAAAQMAETMTDNLGGDLKELGSKAEAFGITLYNSFNEPLRNIVQLGTDYIKQLIDAFNDGSFEGLASALGDVLGQAVTKLSEALPTITELGASVIHSLSDGIMSNIGTIADSAAQILVTIVDCAVDIIPDVLNAGLEIFGALAKALADSAPHLADAAATGIGDLIDGITKQLPNIAASAVKIVSAIADSLKKNFPKLKNSARDLIVTLGELIQKNLPDLIKSAVEIVVSLAEMIGNNVDVILDAALVLIETLAMSLIENIDPIVDAAVEIVTTLAVWLVQNIDKIVEIALEIVRALAKALIENAPELIGAAAVLLVAIGEAFTNFLNAIKDTLNKWIGELLSTIGDFFSDQYECAVESAEEMIGYIADFWSSVGQSIGNALAALGKTIKDAYDAAVDGTEQLIEDTVNFFKSLPTKISESLSNALAKISKWGTDAYNSAVNSAKNTINGIVDYFTGLPAKIAAKLLEALNKVTTWGSDLVQKGRTAASDLVTAIVEGIKSLPDKLKDIGKQLVSGLWDGIKDSTDWLGEKVENFGGNLVGKVKGVFGIHSPSKVMRDSVGVHLAQGIGEGFTEELPEVGRDALAAFKQLEIAEPRIRYDSGAVEALRLQGNLGTPNIAPSATSETINNHYSYSTVNNNAPKTPENTPINVSLYVDGKLAAEGSAELNDREQGERIKLRKRGLAD